ncbi:MAG: hypothetical protein JXR25_08420 [Pontiellaceae bacterium]|nr:hypothetical protein [Pontiellaceae bacterium]MBN2784838.1 hypothetical protein [Pontiellaceae bacterium]
MSVFSIEPSDALAEKNSVVKSMDAVALSNAAGSEEIASAGQELASQVEDPDTMVDALLKLVHGERVDVC